MRKSLALAALLVPASAMAQSAQGDIAITIYNNDIALVQDTRQINFPDGRVRQEFPDVSARIRPETATLVAADLGIIEQNFDFDLLTPAKLMEKAVGQTVTLIRTNPATGKEENVRAKVLAANGGVVLQIGQSIEVLRDDGLPVRVIFDKVPENLRARPTLSVTVESDRAGPRPARLTYLTGGLGWKSDYVALFDEAKGGIDVQGWITLTNNSGVTYNNAETLLVAGDPYNGGGYSGGNPNLRRAGTESNDRARLGDFYLYPLAARTTIANQQTKQVSFLDVKAVPARKAYEFVNEWLANSANPQSAATVLKFTSARAGGLGDQLPAGTVRVYIRDAKGTPQFIGENNIGHTPMGSELAIPTGEAFDVKVKSIVELREKVGKLRWKTAMRYIVSNARDEPVTVDLAQDGLWGDTRVAAQSIEGKRVSADRMEWTVPVPANGETEVTVTFDTRF
ncbi:DUF4139 domain-containing protein [Sphingobium boeckii]|uniref:DUF4139 domain-containing protein n=1 Tax=Sphingobium boeckii TaxID=1082345 RepID=A0A7W9ECN7_9SPHN|nr:DUF4139 domain-containing protein [Sphingobium boeckii]MBB5684257.1 hypothetical protein [Sphingobium boeckii]